MPNFIDLTGRKIGRWTVAKRDGYRGKTAIMWLCECDCGTIRRVSGAALGSGKSLSCGCIRKEMFQEYVSNIERVKNDFFEVDDETMGCYVRSRNREIFYFDRVDYDKVKDNAWWISDKGYIYTQRNGSKKRSSIPFHRFILDIPDGIVDHIDRNPLNNKRNNLRIVSTKENGRNISVSYDNTSGFIGVCKTSRKSDNECEWRSRINVDGREYTKSFRTKHDAIVQRLSWELEFYGSEFAPQRHLFKEYGIS